MNAASTLPSLIESRQDELNLTDEALARALNYASTTAISMIKAGRLSLPINKVEALAGVLDLDAAVVLRQLMAERCPGMLEAIEAIINPLHLTTTELNLIHHCRALAGDTEVAPLVFSGRTVIALVAS